MDLLKLSLDYSFFLPVDDTLNELLAILIVIKSK